VRCVAAPPADEFEPDGRLVTATVTRCAVPAASVRPTAALIRRRAVEDPELFVVDEDPQPARRSPTRVKIAIRPHFLMAGTVLADVPER